MLASAIQLCSFLFLFCLSNALCLSDSPLSLVLAAWTYPNKVISGKYSEGGGMLVDTSQIQEHNLQQARISLIHRDYPKARAALLWEQPPPPAPGYPQTPPLCLSLSPQQLSAKDTEGSSRSGEPTWLCHNYSFPNPGGRLDQPSARRSSPASIPTRGRQFSTMAMWVAPAANGIESTPFLGRFTRYCVQERGK
jgi:hypothetical protein